MQKIIHAVPDSHYIRWGHRHERPSGSGQTAPLIGHTTPQTEGPQSSPALASPSSTGRGGKFVSIDNECEDSGQLEDTFWRRYIKARRTVTIQESTLKRSELTCED